MSALKGSSPRRAKRPSGHVHIAESPTIIEVERREDEHGYISGRTSSCSSCSGSASGDGTDDGVETFCDRRLLVETTTIKFGILQAGGVYERNFELRVRDSAEPIPFQIVTARFLPYLSIVPAAGVVEPGGPFVLTIRLETGHLVGRVCVSLYVLLDGETTFDADTLPSLLVTAKVMSRDRGKPALRNGVRCIVHPDAVSETTEPDDLSPGGFSA
eukprot:Amastigsp_a3540_22.p1 type:complete len:215 gc:universal Amastigsp_a3540_22:767-123(-)